MLTLFQFQSLLDNSIADMQLLCNHNTALFLDSVHNGMNQLSQLLNITFRRLMDVIAAKFLKKINDRRLPVGLSTAWLSEEADVCCNIAECSNLGRRRCETKSLVWTNNCSQSVLVICYIMHVTANDVMDMKPNFNLISYHIKSH